MKNLLYRTNGLRTPLNYFFFSFFYNIMYKSYALQLKKVSFHFLLYLCRYTQAHSKTSSACTMLYISLVIIIIIIISSVLPCDCIHYYYYYIIIIIIIIIIIVIVYTHTLSFYLCSNFRY